MSSRRIVVTYETIRQCAAPASATTRRQEASRRGSADHQGQASLPVARCRQDIHTLDVLVQSRCNRQAAKKQIMPGVEHRQHKGNDSRAELSHQPTRQMRRFKSPGHAQRFLSAHIPINNAIRCQRNRLSAVQYRGVRTDAFSLWNEVARIDNIL